MSRHGADRERIYQALVVDAFGDVSWDEYVRATSRADPTELEDTA